MGRGKTQRVLRVKIFRVQARRDKKTGQGFPQLVFVFFFYIRKATRYYSHSIVPVCYKRILEYLQVNEIKEKMPEDIVACFEYEYDKDGVHYMDIFMAMEVC